MTPEAEGARRALLEAMVSAEGLRRTSRALLVMAEGHLNYLSPHAELVDAALSVVDATDAKRDIEEMTERLAKYHEMAGSEGWTELDQALIERVGGEQPAEPGTLQHAIWHDWDHEHDAPVSVVQTIRVIRGDNT